MISNEPQCKPPSDSQQYHLKLCLIKHKLDIIVNLFKIHYFKFWFLLQTETTGEKLQTTLHSYLKIVHRKMLHCIVLNES